jgi:predicted site-specific integrase-resolvase
MTPHIDLTNNEEPYQRLAIVAEKIGIRYKTLLRWSKREDFPVLRLPEGELRVRPSEVAQWLEKFQRQEVDV